MSDNWWSRIIPSFGSDKEPKSNIPEGVWEKCPKCEAVLYKPELNKHLEVCYKCNHHLPIGARERVLAFLDQGSATEIFEEMASQDALKFKDSKRYKDRLTAAEKQAGEKEALLSFEGKLEGQSVVCVAFVFEFMGGSMASVVGSKFTAAAEKALAEKKPLICFSASGGARMQEALFSLMQMAKTSAVLEKMKQLGVPYVSVMTNPTYGGVTASLAMLGDINLAEPGAMIGFAGPRVIEQTVRQTLPEGFQTSEFLLEHGMIDRIVSREDMRQEISTMLGVLADHLK
ncbi:MAG: acetyl-CoA carboxylase, carboxyltransferase subunit beta [Pseudomonadota bacterium]|nr:acetyl-CoA carboxylase, carboxyltransferase subunit beta [Pseudomonadota bacterium]